MAGLALRNVSKDYGTVRTISDVSLDIGDAMLASEPDHILWKAIGVSRHEVLACVLRRALVSEQPATVRFDLPARPFSVQAKNSWAPYGE